MMRKAVLTTRARPGGRLAAVLFTVSCLGGCAFWQTSTGTSGGEEENAEMTNLEIANYYGEAVAARVTELRTRRDAALAAPQDLNAASAFG